MAERLVRRLWTYQGERFPLAVYVPLMAVAALAAVAVPAAARGAGRFPWGAWAVGAVTLVVFFFFLRALDEHKDAAGDARYRPELPVPRGLVTLRELRRVAAVSMLAVILLNGAMSRAVLVPLALALAWAGLMGREFFVRDWLRARPLAYLLSHMLVMPLIFLYATTLDWLVASDPVPNGTAAFLTLAFCNGLVIEIGRKVRSPADEREGVETYSAVWGLGPAVTAWIGALLIGGLAAVATADAFEAGLLARALLTIFALLAAGAGAVALRGHADRRARWIEPAAAFWTLASYGTLGIAALLRIG